MIRCRLDSIPELSTKEGPGKWEPKEKGHGAKPDFAYTRKEAARFFHYTWGEFCREDPVRQAEVVAHYVEHGFRESYALEKSKEAAEKEPPKKPGSDRPGWAGSLFDFRQGGGAE